MGIGWGWVSGGGGVGVGVGIWAVVGGWVSGGVRVGMDLGWRWELYKSISSKQAGGRAGGGGGGGGGGGWGKMLFPATQSCQGKEWGPATWAGPKGRLARAPARAI
ncbi:unnamed protein product [Prunus armeniaca]